MDQQTVLDLFTYQDGTLFHRKSLTNGVKEGDPVGSLDKYGYLQTTIKRRSYRVHRLIYLMHHGHLPRLVDHIDGDIRNNKIENLREVTYSQSNLNKGIDKRNTTGYKGVSFVKSTNKFKARLTINHKRMALGCFKTAEEAYAAYCEAAQQHGNGFVRTK